jgi:hypothetical protein
MRLGSVLGQIAVGLVLSSCVASRGSLHALADGGVGAGDATKDAASCSLPEGGNDLSFDFDCTGYCVASVHFDYHLDPGAAGYPGCDVGNGNLEFPHLTGSEMSTLELGLATYGGPGKYELSSPDVFSFAAMLMPDGDLPCGIQSVIPDPDVSAEAGASPTCTVVVTSDCEDHDGHTVTGTLECTLPNAEPNATCLLKNGKFTFGACP